MSTPLQDFLNELTQDDVASAGVLSPQRQAIVDYLKADSLRSVVICASQFGFVHNPIGNIPAGLYEGSDLEWLVNHGYLQRCGNIVRA